MMSSLMRKVGVFISLLLMGFLLQMALISQSRADDKVTILYDAFGKSSEMRKDWGFSALIEYHGMKILFDTGDNAEIFAHNVEAKNIDLHDINFALISHRHGDHIAGLPYLFKVNPDVRVYAPKENFGIFGSSLPGSFFNGNESLPIDHRYFDGNPPETIKFGDAWDQKFELIDKTTEIVPGVFVISTVSENPGTLELRELSLAIKTPKGLVVIVGCSHPGIEKILKAAKAIDPHIHQLIGGMHLISTSEQEIQKLSLSLRDTWKIDLIAPGHCTGETAFAVLAKDFGDRYVYAGLGETIWIQ